MPICFMSERNNKKIIFVNPPLSVYERYGQLGRTGGSEPPLGLCYLSAKIRKAGFNVRIIDAQASELNLKETVYLIRDFKPDYVGITASTMAIESASALAQIIKTMLPSIKIIIGGCHVSSLPIDTLREHKFFDIGVIGEGEETLQELLLFLNNKINLNTVKGIVMREDRYIFTSESRARIKNLDNLPYPAFDLLPEIHRFYRVPTQNLANSYSFSLVTSRGCAGRCSFCDKKIFGDYISMHSAEYIVEMLYILNKNYSVNNILFADDNFIFSKQRLQSIIDLSIKKKLKISWSVLSRIDCVDKESLKMAKDGGCWQISYGIESGSQRILDFYGKGIKLQQIRDTIELTKKVGLKIRCFFMWGNPTEDSDSVKETISFIKDLEIDDISITYFTPYPGSQIWPQINSYGDFDKTWHKMSCFHFVFKPHSVDKEYLIKTRKKVLKAFYFRTKIIFSYLTRIRSLEQVKEVILSAFCLLYYIFNIRGQDD